MNRTVPFSSSSHSSVVFLFSHKQRQKDRVESHAAVLLGSKSPEFSALLNHRGRAAINGHALCLTPAPIPREDTDWSVGQTTFRHNLLDKTVQWEEETSLKQKHFQFTDRSEQSFAIKDDR